MTSKRLSRTIWLFLCVVALVVQSAPAGASTLGNAVPCSMPPQAVANKPAHSCCPVEAKPCGRACCAKPASSSGLGEVVAKQGPDACKCEIAPRSEAPVALVAAFHPSAAALPTTPLLPAFEPLPFVEPGIVGSDSGPPLGGERAPDKGRAPPIA